MKFKLNSNLLFLNGYYYGIDTREYNWEDMDNLPVKEGDWIYFHVSKEIMQAKIDGCLEMWLYDYRPPKVLFTNNTNLKGVPILKIPNEAMDLAYKHTDKLLLTSEGRTQRWFGFQEGYDKAKETYKWTDEDILKAISLGRELKDDSPDTFTIEDISGLTETCTYGLTYCNTEEQILHCLAEPKKIVEIELEGEVKVLNGNALVSGKSNEVKYSEPFFKIISETGMDYVVIKNISYT